MSKWLSNLLILLCLSCGVIGCEKDPMQQGRTAIAAGNADVAETAFKKVLKKDPDNVEANRMMATVLRLRGEYQASENSLKKLWADHKFESTTTELTPDMKTLRRLMKDQFKELYMEWSASIPTKDEPALFEEVTLKALKYDPKSAKLNSAIVNFHIERAERAVESGDGLLAADEYDKVKNYRTLPKTRDEATQKAAELRRSVFQEIVKASFAELKPNLVQEGRWDEERQSASIVAVAEFEERIRKNNPASVERARGSMGPTLSAALGVLVEQMTGFAIPRGATQMFGSPKHTIDEQKLGRNTYTVKMSVTLKDAEEHAYKVAEHQRRTKAGEVVLPAKPEQAEPVLPPLDKK